MHLRCSRSDCLCTFESNANSNIRVLCQMHPEASVRCALLHFITTGIEKFSSCIQFFLQFLCIFSVLCPYVVRLYHTYMSFCTRFQRNSPFLHHLPWLSLVCMHLVRSGLPFKRTAAEEVTAHCPCLLSNVSFFVHSCGVLSLELFIDGAGNVGLAQHKGAFSFSYNR